jgi:hypothetical protein
MSKYFCLVISEIFSKNVVLLNIKMNIVWENEGRSETKTEFDNYDVIMIVSRKSRINLE